MDSLDSIKHQVNAGDQEGARLALRELLEAEPDNTDAWALLAILLADPADKAECYRQILRVNPTDRHAATWLEALEPDVRRSSMDTMPVGKQPGRALSTEPSAGQGDLDKLLEDMDLPGLANRTSGRTVDPEMDRDLGEDLTKWPEAQPGRPGFLGRFLGQRQRARPEAPSLGPSLNDEDPTVQPGSLNPADILRMAGGPLPPEERRKCPVCGAVVSRKESRCPWCSASLQEAE